MPVEYRDQKILCKNCGREFVWTATAQETYFRKNFKPPKRCVACRRERRGAGGVWGTRVFQTDAVTRKALCSFCSKPASRNLSIAKGRAVCAMCAGSDQPTMVHDTLTVEEWIEIAGSLVQEEKT